MKRHYAEIVREAEQRISALLETQCRDTASAHHGGWLTPERGYSEPGHSSGAIDSLLSVYLCPEADLERDEALLRSAELYADHLLRAQHEDGTIDLRETNFHDATMIGFCTQTLAFTLQLVQSHMDARPELSTIESKIETFLRRGGEGMLTGGFHTPNHRWVLASALTLLWQQFDDERFRREAELYLAEGIDCTDQGEYTERSTGIYNVVNNRSLLIMADILQRPELMDPVQRNLRMVLHYIEPDGSLFTAASRRQDRGRTSYPISYYPNFLGMAHQTGDPLFAGVADLILEQARAGRRSADGLGAMLTQYLLSASLRDDDLPTIAPEPTYTLYNPASGIVRLRHQQMSITLLEQATTFMYIALGEIRLNLKISTTFYGDRGRFTPQSLDGDGDEWRLFEHKRWGFKRPFAEPPGTSDWDQMPHETRAEVQMRDLDLEVNVRWRPQESAVDVDYRSQGLEGVLYKLELAMSAGGQLETDQLRLPCDAGQSVVLRSGGEAMYRLGSDVVRMTGGSDEHNSTRAMRGSEPPDASAFTLYCTGVTPVEGTLRIERVGL